MPPDSARQLRRAARVSVIAYLLAAVFPLLVVAAHDDLLSRDFDKPISYIGGDALGALAGAKNLIDSGWCLHAKYLGAPSGGDYYDYPQCDFLNNLLLKILTLITHNAAESVTLFYLVSFPLCAWAALWALRKMGISPPAATLCAVLYTLLPYHFYRGQVHLYLDNYALIPPAALIAVQLAAGVKFDGDIAANKRRRLAFLIVAATVCTGVYYGFFGTYLIVIGGMLGAVRARSWEPLKSAGALAMVAAIVLVINLAPTIWYRHANGPNTEIGGRRLDEAEVYALRLTYLLLPADGHRVHALAAITRVYDQSINYVLESRSEALGMVGDIGFIVLVTVLVLAAARRDPGKTDLSPVAPGLHDVTMGTLAALNFACILLATTAGIGSLIAFFISPMIRSYDRISVVIAFLCLAAIGLLIDRYVLGALHSRGRGGLAMAILAGLLIFATLDEVPSPPIDRAQMLVDWDRDANFVASIERTVPKESMIFQLPYVAFPESGNLEAMGDYDPFRGYLHSATLHWSYATMRGRAQDRADRDLANLPAGQMVPRLRALGFAGIWIDLYGYDPSQRRRVATDFASATASNPLVSGDPDHRFLFYKIAP